MLRKAGNMDISRIAEILIFTKRTTYRPIFKNDNVSFNEMQVLKEIEKLSSLAHWIIFTYMMME